MAKNFTIPRTTSHIRSTSLPTTCHPLDSNIEVLLHKLSNVETLISGSSICHALNEVHTLYNSVNDLIQCPVNQQCLSLEQHRNGVEDVLEGSMGLIDSYASTKDVLSLMKESILELRSCLRRKNGGEEKDINAYMMSRKKIQKMANNSVKNLLKTNSKNEGGSDNSIPIFTILREVEAISFSTLTSILCYLSKSKGNGKNWSIIAKLMHPKSVSSNGVEHENEIQRIDQAISGLEPKNSSVKLKMVQEVVQDLALLESLIQEIETCLESISRCLLKTRVSLLNVVSSR